MIVASEQAVAECCSCATFAAAVAGRGPYGSVEELITAARTVWWHQTPVTGWLEAFAAHPKIGDLEGLRKKFGGFAELSKGEQAAAAGASEGVLQELAEWNRQYEAKYGHIFIVCASGKSAEQMLAAIQQRFANAPAAELTNAAVEQQKITELRLRKTFGAGEEAAAGGAAAAAGGGAPTADRRAAAPPLRSPITTHVLDTCMGRPAPGVHVTLARLAPGSAAPSGGGGAWEAVAAGQTNKDGRIGDLLPSGDYIQPGHYRIAFDTSEYMQRCREAHPGFFAPRPFYPSAAVEFEIQPHQSGEHFHVPLTWNPYGYSTYRGS